MATTRKRMAHVSEGCRLISEERADQLGKWPAAHDDREHPDGELAEVAARILCPGVLIEIPAHAWGDDLAEKLVRGARVRALQVAGALVAAEIDRLLRAEGR